MKNDLYKYRKVKHYPLYDMIARMYNVQLQCPSIGDCAVMGTIFPTTVPAIWIICKYPFSG